jgi:integrase
MSNFEPKLAEEYLLVKKIREQISQVNLQVSEKTASEYRKVFQKLQENGTHFSQASSKNTFYKQRAASIFVLAESAKSLMNARDKVQKGTQEHAEIVQKLTEISTFFNDFPANSTPENNETGSKITWKDVKSDEKMTSFSKKTGLGKLVKIENWEQKLFEKCSSKHQNALAISLVSGCRPAEIEAGIQVKKDENGNLILTIKGAKLSEIRGQETRELSISPDHFAARHLLAQLGNGNEIVISSNSKAFSEATRQAGKRAFPRLKIGVSPYSIRHAVASQLKASGIAQDAIAMTLGHAATASQSAYGRAHHGTSGAASLAIVGVSASRAVRDTVKPPPPERARRFAAPGMH